MKRKYFLPILILSLFFAAGCLTPVSAIGTDGDDSDDLYEDDFASTFSTSWFENHREKEVYVITTAIQLQGLADLVNTGRYDGYLDVANHYETFEGKTIKLGRDITVDSSFTPIGSSEELCFRGTFDGDGHTIKGLSISENGGYTGLFGYLDGTVKNLKLEGSVRSTGAMCGSVAGYLGSSGVIKNCKAKVRVSGKAKTGGIAGENDGGRISDCVSRGDVAGTVKVGGVVGENRGSVTKCGNRGEVRSTQRGATTYGTGGVCGRSVGPDSLIDRCFNTGNISSYTEGTGGVCGYMNAAGAKVISCYNTGNMKVTNNFALNSGGIRGYAGGIVGIAGAKGVVIDDCYNAGAIDNSDVSGGIIGEYVDDPESSETDSIKNNFYLSATGVKGIGNDFNGKSVNIKDGTDKIAQAALQSSTSRLGSDYLEDPQNDYGAGGYPVLRWQKNLGKANKTRLTCISADAQAGYDRFLEKHPASTRAEWPVIIFFNHSAFTSQAIGDYHEQQHK